MQEVSFRVTLFLDAFCKFFQFGGIRDGTDFFFVQTELFLVQLVVIDPRLSGGELFFEAGVVRAEGTDFFSEVEWQTQCLGICEGCQGWF